MLKKITLFATLLLLVAPQLSFAQVPDAKVEPQLIPQGLVDLSEGYQVFPEGKLGNSLYHKKKRIFSNPEAVVKDIFPLEGKGVFIYAANLQDQPTFHLVGNDEAKLTEPVKGYALVVLNSKKKLLRISPTGKIQSLLPRSNTPDGLTENGKGIAAFSHIIGGKNVEVDGKTLYEYTYKVHIVRSAEERVVHIKKEFKSTDLPLKLTWLKPKTLQVTQSNGTLEQISLR